MHLPSKFSGFYQQRPVWVRVAHVLPMQIVLDQTVLDVVLLAIVCSVLSQLGRMSSIHHWHLLLTQQGTLTFCLFICLSVCLARRFLKPLIPLQILMCVSVCLSVLCYSLCCLFLCYYLSLLFYLFYFFYFSIYFN